LPSNEKTGKKSGKSDEICGLCAGILTITHNLRLEVTSDKQHKTIYSK